MFITLFTEYLEYKGNLHSQITKRDSGKLLKSHLNFLPIQNIQ